MSDFRLVWIDERLLDDDFLETIDYWKNLNDKVYFYNDEVILNLKSNSSVESIRESLELVENLSLETYSIIKSEVIFTEELVK